MHPLIRGGCRRAVWAALFVSAACGNPLSPLDVAGTYRLERREGAPLPALVYSGGATDIYLLSETLVLGLNRRGSITWVQEHRPAAGDAETITSQRDIAFDVVEGRIEIEMICGPAELCSPPPHLVLRRTAHGLESIGGQGPQPALVYGRVTLIGFGGLP